MNKLKVAPQGGDGELKPGNELLKVDILRRTLLHGHTAANLTRHQLEKAAKKCKLTRILSEADIENAMKYAMDAEEGDKKDEIGE